MTTFGEIALPSTRTAWEDWDDAENQNAESEIPELKWKEGAANAESINSLTILEGKYLTDFINLQSNCELLLVDSIPEVGLSMYRELDINRYLVAIKDYNLVLSSEVVELLKPYLDVSHDVVAIQTKPLADYQSNALSVQQCIIRTVTSSKSANKANYPKLEQPNIISGISAGVISLREHLSQRGMAIVCYLDQLEEYRVDAVQKLLEDLTLLKNIKSKPSRVLDSNLYI